MQNFGRGMWRRVGDFERIQVPQILKYAELEQAMIYDEYMRNLKRQNEINEYRQNILKKVNSPIFVEPTVHLNEIKIKNVDPIKEDKELKEIKEVKGEINTNIEISNVNPRIEIIAVETEISTREPVKVEEEKTPIIFPKKGWKRR
jgi:hypothetical protein